MNDLSSLAGLSLSRTDFIVPEFRLHVLLLCQRSGRWGTAMFL